MGDRDRLERLIGIAGMLRQERLEQWREGWPVERLSGQRSVELDAAGAQLGDGAGRLGDRAVHVGCRHRGDEARPEPNQTATTRLCSRLLSSLLPIAIAVDANRPEMAPRLETVKDQSGRASFEPWRASAFGSELPSQPASMSQFDPERPWSIQFSKISYSITSSARSKID